MLDDNGVQLVGLGVPIYAVHDGEPDRVDHVEIADLGFCLFRLQIFEHLWKGDLAHDTSAKAQCQTHVLRRLFLGDHLLQPSNNLFLDGRIDLFGVIVHNAVQPMSFEVLLEMNPVALRVREEGEEIGNA